MDPILRNLDVSNKSSQIFSLWKLKFVMKNIPHIFRPDSVKTSTHSLSISSLSSTNNANGSAQVRKEVTTPPAAALSDDTDVNVDVKVRNGTFTLKTIQERIQDSPGGG